VSDEGKIEYAGPTEHAPDHGGERLDVGGLILAPGLIDIHRHGGFGVAFGMGADIAGDLNAFAERVCMEGITGFLCSLVAPDADALLRIIEACVPALEADAHGAEALGLHLEGPYLNRDEKRGAFSPHWLRDPSPEEARAFLEAGKGWIRQMTIDPSLPGADEVAALCKKFGAVAALGHTNMDYEGAEEALRGNFSHVTHTYNCLRELHHREPGALGAVLASDDVTTELIPDAYHVHPGAMKILLRCVGAERIVLVTDSIVGPDTGDGDYDLVEHTIKVEDGEAKLSNGTIAGCTTAFNRCVGIMNKQVGVPLHQAVQMATLNPASAMGLANRLGGIAVGNDASLIVIDEDMNIFLVMVKGKIVLNRL
jgi:N-acetylglucosamine-6-phosphate deacetylase